MVTLETSVFFKDLTPEDLSGIKQVSREVVFGPNQTIFKEGDLGDGVYVVKEGQVQISTLVTRSDRRILTHIQPGEIFGELAVLDRDPRSATATTTDHPAVLYFIPRTELLELLEKKPRVALQLVREISKRLRVFNQRYVNEVLQSERLALVGRFASSIVHDLKNPLNIIGISADMMGMPNVTTEARMSSKDRIRRQVDRISNMVNELLDFTRGSQTSVVMALVDYPVFVKQVIDEIRPEVEIKSIQLEIENEPPNVRVAMNPPRLNRVYHNLIHNAVDALPNGGRIVVRFRLENNEVVTEFEDTGNGIAPEILGKLFQAFVTHGKVHGTGLGLCICKRIIEDHKGAISARNVPGRGAIFAFTLPLHITP